jgi:uncharacterized protein YhaN
VQRHAGWLGKRAEAERLSALALDLRQRLDAELRAAIERADADAAAARATLTGLMSQAGCADLQGLALAEERSQARRALEEELRTLEEGLVRSAAMSLEDLLAQCRAQDLVTVKAALAGAAAELGAASDLVARHHARLIAACASFEGVDGGDAAAQAEQDAAQHAASIAGLSAGHAAARLAGLVLGRVMQQYQARNQGPIVARASQLFADITGGAFAGLAVDFDEDAQVLVAVRPDGRRLGVTALSSGRRDQLYLALRLAAIERHVQVHEPMPLVVDDILIQFDNAAAGATFRALAGLARSTQVLFFIHHEHLLGQAAAALGAGGFASHGL